MYIYPRAGYLERHAKVRDGECVAIVQEFTSAPATRQWKAGVRVIDAPDLKHGTAIATMINGRYPSYPWLRRHAALYMRKGPPGPDGKPTGFWVVEQYNHPPITAIQARFIRRKGLPQNEDGSWPDASNNADAFYVIE